jgi:hypothetical protein
MEITFYLFRLVIKIIFVRSYVGRLIIVSYLLCNGSIDSATILQEVLQLLLSEKKQFVKHSDSIVGETL